jgi:diguanylate cyclase (GGDEF)-like protein
MSAQRETGQPPASRTTASTSTRAETTGIFRLLDRLTRRGVFWAIVVGSLGIAGVLTLAASLLFFHSVRAELLFVSLGAGGITAVITAFSVRAIITRLLVQQARLERLATVDELTGSPNRRVFRERMESEVDRCSRLGTRLCLVFLDVDFFKRINDDYGHQVGDTVLREVYAQLEASRRLYDFVGRLGGDEFVMALPGTDAAGGVAVAERLRESVMAGPAERLHGVTISLGVAELEKGMSAETLLSHADAALYRAKNGGRNRTEMHRRPPA